MNNIVNKKLVPDEIISVAPMMDCTDRHFRRFIRFMSEKTFLYTEMIYSGAILKGDKKRFLSFDPAEAPIAIQLGGNDPDELAESAKIAQDWGYSEVNLNLGCPSPRVKSGGFGAYLMKDPDLVTEIYTKMSAAVSIPVTIKVRTGVDDLDSFEYFYEFIQNMSEVGCKKIIIHARKACLTKFTPKQNRQIPPLEYDKAQKIKELFPHLKIIVNGGITTFEQAKEMLNSFDGVMIGRAAYHSPLMFTEADPVFYSQQSALNDLENLIDLITEYMGQDKEKLGTPVRVYAKHLLNFFRGWKKSGQYRKHISDFLLTNSEDINFFRRAAIPLLEDNSAMSETLFANTSE